MGPLVVWPYNAFQNWVDYAEYAKSCSFRSQRRGVIGLRLISQGRFGLVLDANGTMLRVTNVQNFKPQQFTILGWDVTDIDGAVADLNQRGVRLENYGMAEQNERGIWKSPSGARVAWFKDPDGNVLSLTQFP